ARLQSASGRLLHALLLSVPRPPRHWPEHSLRSALPAIYALHAVCLRQAREPCHQAISKVAIRSRLRPDRKAGHAPDHLRPGQAEPQGKFPCRRPSPVPAQQQIYHARQTAERSYSGTPQYRAAAITAEPLLRDWKVWIQTLTWILQTMRAPKRFAIYMVRAQMTSTTMKPALISY